jgi:hypothetical protein
VCEGAVRSHGCRDLPANCTADLAITVRSDFTPARVCRPWNSAYCALRQSKTGKRLMGSAQAISILADVPIIHLR